MTPSAQRYADRREASFAAARLREGPDLFPESTSVRPGSELAWQSRWFAGHFGRDFTSTNGQTVRIVQFGWWNHGAGPDFRDCAVEIDGVLRKGSIELDLDAADWEGHGHAGNPAYEDVVLHLYLFAGTNATRFTRTAAHREIPQVRLDPGSVPPGAVSIPPARPGRCLPAIRQLPPDDWLTFMEDAARFRMDRKARRWMRVASVHGEDEAWWQGFADAFGYARNQLPMTVLSQRLPLRWLQKRLPDAEAILFGVAGFLDGSALSHGDEPTRQYLRGLWESWWRYRAEFAPGEPHAPITWTLSGTRPTNHPQRRTAALAVVAASWRRIRPFLSPAAFDSRKAIALLASLEHPYWCSHYTLASAQASRPLALIGRSRAAECMANLCFPILLSERPELWEDYVRIPAAPVSERLRRAGLRLFGSEDATSAAITRLWQQQALLQIYDDFCMQDASDCVRCPFPEQVAGGSS